MKNYLSLLLIALFLTQSFAADFPEEEGVLVLDDQNFDEAIKKHENLLVEFYAPWCGHCKELAPHYAKAAQRLRQESSPLYLAKVDATINTELAKKNEIEGFPTLKFYKNGEPEEYSGGRTEDEIVQWMKKKTGPASVALTAANDVTEFANRNEVAVVFFGTDEKLYKIFIELAKAYDDLSFAECRAEECLSHFSVSSGNVVIFRKFDAKNAEIRTNYTAEEFKTFVDQNTTKLVSTFDEKTAQLIFGKQVPGLFFYRTKGSDAEATFDALANSVAENLRGKIQIVVCDIQDGLEQRLAEYIGITNADLPTIRIHDTREDLKKYNLEGENTRENILTFVTNWLDGKLVAKLKSEDESVTSQNTSPVTPLVGTNFVTLVNDASKDVLVEFYAPWCGHCQKLTPIYEELAAKLKETNPNILITKIDATANDVEGQDIQGFPTIKLFKKEDKVNAVDFDGERDLSGLVDFLQAQIKDFVRPEGVAPSTPKADAPEEEAEEANTSEEGEEVTEAQGNSTRSEEL